MARALLPAARAAVLSQQELAWIANVPVRSPADQGAAAERLLRRGTEGVFVLDTEAAKTPVCLYTGDVKTEYPPWPRHSDVRFGIEWLATFVAGRIAQGGPLSAGVADAMEYVESEATHG